MKKFNFRLDHLLHLREQQEELCKIKLGQATRKVEEIDLAIDQTKQEEYKALAEYHDVSVMFFAQQYILRMQAERRRLTMARIKAEEQRMQMLGEYIQAKQMAEVLRRLRNRHESIWKKEYLEQQDAIADDLSASGRLVHLGLVSHSGEV